MRRSSAAAGSSPFFLLAPGMVAGVVRRLRPMVRGAEPAPPLRRHRHRLAAVAALAACLLAGGQAGAVEPLAHDLKIDIPVTAVAGLGWISSEVGLKSTLAPAACRWCDGDGSGKDSLNGFDAAGRSLRWSDPRVADTLSNLDAFVLLPVALLGLDALAAHRDGALDGWPVDAVILVETVSAQAALNQLVKFAVGRERPFVHVLPAGEKGFTAAPSDNNLSFYSGHSSLAFSLAVGAGTIAHLRGYRSEPLIWAVGLPLAAGAAYLRMAADKHYATDVIVGSIAGAALGFVVPSLFHRRAASGPSGRFPTLVAVSIPLSL
jgi:membrane-associated phospholipid phosphatase